MPVRQGSSGPEIQLRRSHRFEVPVWIRGSLRLAVDDEGAGPATRR